MHGIKDEKVRNALTKKLHKDWHTWSIPFGIPFWVYFRVFIFWHLVKSSHGINSCDECCYRQNTSHTYSYWFILKCLKDKIADNSAIIHMHAWPKCIKDTCNPDFHFFLDKYKIISVSDYSTQHSTQHITVHESYFT